MPTSPSPTPTTPTTPTLNPKVAAALAADPQGAEAKLALIVLGPQVLDGRTHTAVGAHDRLPCRAVPLDREGRFRPDSVVVEIL